MASTSQLMCVVGRSQHELESASQKAAIRPSPFTSTSPSRRVSRSPPPLTPPCASISAAAPAEHCTAPAAPWLCIRDATLTASPCSVCLQPPCAPTTLPHTAAQGRCAPLSLLAGMHCGAVPQEELAERWLSSCSIYERVAYATREAQSQVLVSQGRCSYSYSSHRHS